MSNSDNINSRSTTSDTNNGTGTNNPWKIPAITSLITIVGTALIALIALIAYFFTRKNTKKRTIKTDFEKQEKDVLTNVAGRNLNETKVKHEVKL